MNNSPEPLDNCAKAKEYITVEQIKQEQLKPYREALEIAHLHIKSNLHSIAVETLERCCNSGTHEAAVVHLAHEAAVVYLALGDISIAKDADSLVKAKKHYKRARKLASAAEDNQVVVAATAGLAKIEAVLGDTKKAETLLQQAKEKFESLPDEEKWSELEEKLTFSTSKNSRLLFLSGCPECPTTIGGPLDGRLSGIEQKCKRC